MPLVTSLVAILLVMLSGCGNATGPPFCMLQLCNDGTYMVLSDGRKVASEKRVQLGDVQNGYLYDDQFYCFDDNALVSVKLGTGERNHILDVRKSITGAQIIPWRVGYVDDRRIMFSGYEAADLRVRVGSGVPMPYNLYQFERVGRTTLSLPIGDCYDGVFSVHDGDLYYSGSGGSIYRASNGGRQATGLRGRNPIVSPDGKKLACKRFGFLFERVLVYDLNDRSSVTIRKAFGNGSFSDVLRWSPDGMLIAVAEQSDLIAKPMYVIDVTQSSVVAEYAPNCAVNWFFVSRDESVNLLKD